MKTCSNLVSLPEILEQRYQTVIESSLETYMSRYRDRCCLLTRITLSTAAAGEVAVLAVKAACCAVPVLDAQRRVESGESLK